MPKIGENHSNIHVLRKEVFSLESSGVVCYSVGLSVLSTAAAARLSKLTRCVRSLRSGRSDGRSKTDMARLMAAVAE